MTENILICFSSLGRARDFADALETTLVSIRPRPIGSLSDAFEMNLEAPVDALVIDEPLMDSFLALYRTFSLSQPLHFKSLVVETHPNVLLLVKAIHYGFDDVLDDSWPDADMANAISAVINGERTIHINPALAAIDLIPGLYRRSIEYGEDGEDAMVQLLSLGLSDVDIAVVLALPVQTVRNRLGRLLRDHGLSSRTQLASLYIRNELTVQKP